MLAEMSYHLGYEPGQDVPEGQTGNDPRKARPIDRPGINGSRGSAPPILACRLEVG